MYSVVAGPSELTTDTASLYERGPDEVLEDFEALMRTVERVGVDPGFVCEMTTPWAKRVAGGGVSGVERESADLGGGRSKGC